MNQRARFQEAAALFINREKEQEDVIGIILAGSMIYAELGKNSDIDIYIILDPVCDYRERGNTWINGVEIEYFKNPPQQIERYFEQEVNSPHSAHMLVHGQVVFQRSSEVDRLIALAKQHLETPLAELSPLAIELARYHVDDLFKDLEDCQVAGDRFGANMLRMELINKSIDLCCQVNRLSRDKHKRLRQQLMTLAPSFVQLLELAQADDWEQNGSMDLLKRQMAIWLGGERPQEWVLRSNLDL